MKKFLLFIALPLAVIGFVIYWLYTKAKANAAAAAPAQTTTSTQTGVSDIYPGWGQFTSASLNNSGVAQTASSNWLSQISNAFGINDGGNNPLVSIAGSIWGGINSSGSGAGNPTPLSNFNSDLWDTTFTQGDYSSSALNNFDVLNSGTTVSSQNSVDTGIGDPDYSDYEES